MAGAVTAGEALADFRAANGIAPGADQASHFSVRIGPLTLRFANAAWRRRAVAAHDLHHVLTGYGCTVIGEFEMAAWEASSGGFPSTAALAVCGVLVLGGLALAPRRTVAAWRRGKAWRNLHLVSIEDALLDRPLAEITAERQRTTRARHSSQLK